MSDKTMYTLTDFPEVARELTRKNMAILYRDSVHHEQINKSINYGDAAQRLEKQRDPEGIEKGGKEGSRGGKIIGHTESGKPIYAKHSADHTDYKNFTAGEHRQAADAHSNEANTVLEGGKSKHGAKGRAHHEEMEKQHRKAHDQIRKERSETKKKEKGPNTDELATRYDSKAAKKAAELKRDEAKYHREKGNHEQAEDSEKWAKIWDEVGQKGKKIEKEQWDNEQKEMLSRHGKEKKDAHDAFHKEYGAAKNDKHAAEIFNRHSKSQDELASKHDHEVKTHWDKYDDEWAKGEKDELQKAEEILIGACIENMIEKGEISDTLGRGYGPASEPIKFVKTGKELKEKIPTIITALAMEIGKAEGMMIEIQKEIGLEPNEPRNSYSIKNISIMSYNWDLCNPIYDKVQQSYPAPSDQNLLCSKYNSLGYMVISMQEDVATLNVMQGNLEDGKKYTLSVSQLIALGF